MSLIKRLERIEKGYEESIPSCVFISRGYSDLNLHETKCVSKKAIHIVIVPKKDGRNEH